MTPYKQRENELRRDLAIRKGNIYGIQTKGSFCVPIEVQKEIDRSLHRLFGTFPELNGFVQVIQFDQKMNARKIAAATIDVNLSVSLKLNPNLFSSLDILNIFIKSKTHFFTNKDSFEDYLRHEFIHFLESRYAILRDKGEAYERISHDYYSREIVKQACIDCVFPYTDDTIEREICIYAKTRASEAVAEACSGGTSKLCKRIEYLVNHVWRG